MIIVSGHVRFAPGEVDRLRPIFEQSIAATRAELGCASFFSAIDVREPSLLHVSGLWSDEPAIEAHMRSRHMSELLEALGAAKVESIRVDAYEGHYLRTLIGEPAAAED